MTRRPRGSSPFHAAQLGAVAGRLQPEPAADRSVPTRGDRELLAQTAVDQAAVAVHLDRGVGSLVAEVARHRHHPGGRATAVGRDAHRQLAVSRERPAGQHPAVVDEQAGAGESRSPQRSETQVRLPWAAISRSCSQGWRPEFSGRADTGRLLGSVAAVATLDIGCDAEHSPHRTHLNLQIQPPADLKDSTAGESMPDTASPPPGAGPGRVNVNTVAEAAQVSRQTVTNALRHPERVRPETLSRVQAEIVRLGYRPASAAQSLQAQRAGAIGVELNALGADYHNAVMAPFIAALTLAAPAHAFHIVTFGSAAPHADPGGLPADVARPRGRRLRAAADTHAGDPRPASVGDRASSSPPSGESGTTLGSFAGSTSTTRPRHICW